MTSFIPRPPAVPGLPTARIGPAGTRAFQSEALAAAGAEDVDTYDLLLRLGGIATGVCSKVYGLPYSAVTQGAQAIRDLGGVREQRDEDLTEKANPLFKRHWLGSGGDSPATESYLVGRRWKKIGADAIGLFGSLMSLNPANLHVNVAGIAYHGHATALTLIHLERLTELAAASGGDAELRDWLAVVLFLKGVKAGIRGGLIAGSAIPAASLPAGIAAAVAITGITFTTIGAGFAAAAKLHFMAFCEQQPIGNALSPPGSKPGGFPARPAPAVNFSRPLPPAPQVRNFSRPMLPTAAPGPPVLRQSAPSPATPPPLPARQGDAATRVVREILSKRGITRALGKYDVDAIIREPAGWLVLADKILMI